MYITIIKLSLTKQTTTTHPNTTTSQRNKKLSYRRVTARCVLSLVILPNTTHQCRNDKSWPNRWYEVGGLVGGNMSQTNRRRSSCVYHLYTDDLLWRNFLTPQCTNCSRDPWPRPLREHSLITRLRLCMTDPCTKFEVSSVSRCGEITRGVKF